MYANHATVTLRLDSSLRPEWLGCRGSGYERAQAPVRGRYTSHESRFVRKSCEG